MIRYIRELRLIPIALIASACLLTLKTADLLLHGSRLFIDDVVVGDANVSVSRPMPESPQPAGSVLSWAHQMFNFPDGSGAPSVTRERAPVRLADRDLPDITGSVDEDAAKKNAQAAAEAKNSEAKNAPSGKGTAAAPPGKDGKPKTLPAGTVIPSDGSPVPTGAERAILERLQERRQELDTRARELDIRQSLIESAEKRMDAKLNEIKEVESRIKVETDQKDEAETARLKSLVTMYENMKPRDAAKIFDKLDLGVLIQVASAIKPQKMSDILAQMSPDTAEKLTVELANKAQQPKPSAGGDLPKIQGAPTAP